MLHVTIMCGGRQSRMKGMETPKQLVEVCGMQLLKRTIAQITSPCTVVADDQRDGWSGTPAWLASHGIPLKRPRESLFLAEVLHQLETVDADQCVFLCGDTVFSFDAVRSINGADTSDGNVHFLCRFTPNIITGRSSCELYGFSFSSQIKRIVEVVLAEALERLDPVRRHITELTDDEATIQSVLEKNLGPWRLLHEFQERSEAVVHQVAVDDYTDDIDGPEDLKTLPLIEKAIQAEAMRERMWR